jgi:hypothetical protein
MAEDELRCWLNAKYQDASLVGKICDFVYRSNEQNRLFYSDYDRLLSESPFRRLFMTGYSDLPFSPEYKPDNAVTLFRELAKRYPDKSGYGYHVVTALLAK